MVLVQLTINLIRGNLRSYIFLVQRTQKIMTLLSYHSSNLSLIALKGMRLIVPKQIPIKISENYKINQPVRPLLYKGFVNFSNHQRLYRPELVAPVISFPHSFLDIGRQ